MHPPYKKNSIQSLTQYISINLTTAGSDPLKGDKVEHKLGCSKAISNNLPLSAWQSSALQWQELQAHLQNPWVH